MSNIDKQAIAGDESVKTYYIHPMAFGSTQNPGYGHVPVVKAEDFEKLRTKLEAADALNKHLELAVRKAEVCSEKLREKAEIAEKRIAELPGQKRLIGWRMADYTDETADPKLAKNWATAVDVLPIFEGDVNTKLSAASSPKGE
jgi:hypothetical protein